MTYDFHPHLTEALDRLAEPALVQFQVGKTYSCRSIGDHDCIWTFTVHARTAKFLTIDNWPGKGTKRVGVRIFQGVECADPLGRYSMSPIISADRCDQDILDAGPK